MIKALVITGALIIAVGCGSRTTTTPSTSASSTTTETSNPYVTYQRLANELGGDIIARGDAAIRASLLCSGAAKSMLGGVPITEFPTDLALIRAYCPTKESNY